MAITSRHVSGSVRLTDNEDKTIHSYHRIRPTIVGPQLELFLQAVGMIRGEAVGNAFLTITAELMETDD